MNESAIQKIPEWTAEDYSTTTPFEWLYQHKDNKFLLMQLCNQIKVAASAVGVKNFLTLWKAYLETVQSQQGIIAANATQFDGQPIELLCGSYYCDDSGITIINTYGFEVVVCSHPIMPVRRLVNIDNGEVQIEIAFKRANVWRQLIFPKSTVASSQKIIELAKFGIAVDSENARDIVKYLTAVENLNYEKLGETLSVGRLGWIGDHGFSPYVENVCFDGDLSFRSMFEAVKPCGSYDKWMECALHIRQGSAIARIALAASFASVLVEPCNALSFIVHMWGGSGSGKTVGLMVVASVWANPAMGTYIRTFNSTSVGQERLAGFCNSLPLCIDELQVIKARKNFDETIYALAEGVGRVRGEKTGGLQRVLTWSNCTITTGEMPISNGASGGGAINRCIEIDCKDEHLFDDPREVVEIIRKNYGHAGRKFVELLQQEEWRELAVETQKTFYDQIQDDSDITEKQAMAGAMILTADALAEQWLFEDGRKLTIDDLKPYLVSKDDVDQNLRAYNWLLGFVASNPTKFIPNAAGDYAGECWGLMEQRDHGDVAFIIKTIFDAKMSDAGFNAASFLSWAKRKEVTICDTNRTTKQKRLKGIGMQVRCVAIRIKEEYEEIDDSEVDF